MMCMVYTNYDIVKHVYEALKKKYDTKEAGARNYDVNCYMEYQMVDERSLEAQCHKAL